MAKLTFNGIEFDSVIIIDESKKQHFADDIHTFVCIYKVNEDSVQEYCTTEQKYKANPNLFMVDDVYPHEEFMDLLKKESHKWDVSITLFHNGNVVLEI